MLGVGRKVVPQPAFLSSSRRCSSVWGDSQQPSVPPRSPGLLPRRCRRDCPVPLRSPSCSAARSLSSPQTPRDGRTPPTDSPFGRVNTGLGGGVGCFPPFPTAMCGSDASLRLPALLHRTQPVLGNPHHDAGRHLHPGTAAKGCCLPAEQIRAPPTPPGPKAEAEFQATRPSVAVGIAGRGVLALGGLALGGPPCSFQPRPPPILAAADGHRAFACLATVSLLQLWQPEAGWDPSPRFTRWKYLALDFR